MRDNQRSYHTMPLESPREPHEQGFPRVLTGAGEMNRTPDLLITNGFLTVFDTILQYCTTGLLSGNYTSQRWTTTLKIATVCDANVARFPGRFVAG